MLTRANDPRYGELSLCRRIMILPPDKGEKQVPAFHGVMLTSDIIQEWFTSEDMKRSSLWEINGGIESETLEPESRTMVELEWDS